MPERAVAPRPLRVALGLGLAVVALAQDWPQFRGPDGNGVCARGRIPLTWSSTSHVSWRLPMAGSGWSQPVIVGDRVFLTSALGEPAARPKDDAGGSSDPFTAGRAGAPAPAGRVAWHVEAVDLKSGTRLWDRTVLAETPRYPVHPSNTYASETPAADAHAVYAWFGSAGAIVALSHDGELRWRHVLGPFRQQGNYGTGSSLRLHRGRLYAQCFSDEQAFVICLDARTGRTLWRRTRPGIARDRLRLRLCGAGRVCRML